MRGGQTQIFVECVETGYLGELDDLEEGGRANRPPGKALAREIGSSESAASQKNNLAQIIMILLLKINNEEAQIIQLLTIPFECITAGAHKRDIISYGCYKYVEPIFEAS